MRAWVATTYSDEDGSMATEGKAMIIQGSRIEIKAITRFLNTVSTYLDSNDYCHMHLHDYMEGWKKGEHIDIEVNAENVRD